MRWVDVCGAPGSGKSTICDPLWSPHAVKWDGLGLPREWDPFLSVVHELLRGLEDHATYRLLVGMTRRSLRKMASVYRRPDGQGIYVQTGLAQRGLGFGWRLQQRGMLDELRPYFRLMPTSVGVAVVDCPVAVAVTRNRLRRLDPGTMYEDRAFMVELMQPAVALLYEVMNDRGVPVLTLDATDEPGVCRHQLVHFAAGRAAPAQATRPGREVAPVPDGVQEQAGSPSLPVAHRSSS